MSVLPARKLFTVHEYNQMISAGVFTGNNKFELMHGEIVKKMVQGDPHIGCINKLNHIFNRVLGGEYIVSIQKGIRIGDFSVPEPDVAILRFRSDFYSQAKAAGEDVLLLIEVSESTIRYDRQVKMPLYASGGVSESWIVNLPRKIIEVHREPQGGKYQVVEKHGRNATITPLLLPAVQIKIADIFG